MDISHDAIGLAEVVETTEHGRELTFNRFRDSFRDMLRHYPTRYPNVQFVWVHQGWMLHRIGTICDYHAAYRESLGGVGKFGVRVERNLRYGLLSEETIVIFPELNPLRGTNALSHWNLGHWLKIANSG